MLARTYLASAWEPAQAPALAAAGLIRQLALEVEAVFPLPVSGSLQQVRDPLCSAAHLHLPLSRCALTEEGHRRFF